MANPDKYLPPMAEFVEDLILMVNHFFSYQYRPGKAKNTPVTYDSIYEVPLYREFRANKFHDCKTWFDYVAYKYYDKLASVTFIIDR